MSLLSTGSTALLAFQRALSTVSHNIANVGTEGYSRQRVELSSRLGQGIGAQYVGGGVQIDDVTRMADNLIGARQLESGGEMGRLGQLSGYASRIDTLLSGASTGIASPWSNFFDAAQGVAAEPASLAARQEMLGRGQSLVQRLQSLDGQLDTLDREINANLKGSVAEANRLGGEIAKLNNELARSGHASNDLLDQRERLVGELGQLVGVTTLTQDDGALNVFTSGGQPLVLGSNAMQLTTVADPLRPERLTVALDTPAGPVNLGAGALSGSIGGALEFRHTVLDPAIADLGRLATGLAASFNAGHRAGMDFYGQMGGDFFTLPAPTLTAHAANTGGGNLSAQVTDIAALDGNNVLLRYDGAAWSAVRADTGVAMAMTGTGTVVDPFVVGGVSVTVGGAANAGDRFLLQPTAGAAGGIALALDDPNRIAAALPVRASADMANVGRAGIATLQVLDASDANLLTPAQIQFIDANNYSLDGGPAVAYAPGDAIAGNGWSLTLDGPPVAGDVFRVATNVAGSSDNGNARNLAVLDDALSLNGGTGSLNAALGQITVAVGSAARQAGYTLEGQQAIHNEITAQRDSVSGVNLDEEAANLLKFQQSYQAAAHVISTADTIFQSLLAAVRR